MTTFSDMAFDLGGRPLGGAKYANPFAKHWFVDGGVTNSGDGKAPDRAYKTIQEAVTAAGVGDVIYVRPKTYVVGTGHARYEECVTVDLAESDLSIIGAGYSRNNEFGVRMKCDGTTLYCFDVSGPSLHLENIGLFASSATNTMIIRNNGATNTQRGSDGFVAYNCNFKGHTTLIQGGQAARFLDCVFNYPTASQLTIGTPSISHYNYQIRGCAFIDNNGASITGPCISDGGGGGYDLWIDNCYFPEIPTNKYITLSGVNTTGMVTRSFFNAVNMDTDTDMSVDSSVFAAVGCYDKTGLIDSTDD